MKDRYSKGGFTLPGEAGYEDLTLRLAEEWGADVIRDSDGTKLSSKITDAGYRIYSTICIIREHNAFAMSHPDCQQQTFLSSDPVLAQDSELKIDLMAGFFAEQFEINASEKTRKYWQVWDRTENRLLDRSQWTYQDGCVSISGCTPYHLYTVSFLCYRIWEEINMYNHTTNHWTSEHLRQLDPRHPEAWAYLTKWLDQWCIDNPQTNVIRLTSLFYNFVWIFGNDDRLRNRYTDWASYDFTVSPEALECFEKEYGYALTAEDFINQGKLQVTHMPPTKAKRDYMDMIQRFVASKAHELVEIIHKHGKQAYVFYDDSWVGMEPNGPYFADVGFDGLIKCVFSGYECRLNAHAKVPVHELRFHPYLFPVGLGGLPTFSEGGHPDVDAKEYWAHVRRALLRECVDRIGLGGYLHLTENFPEFTECITGMAREFRMIRELHSEGKPEVLPCNVTVLTAWGELRTWTLSGHFHETYMHPLIHVIEALSGLPVNVKFMDFEDLKKNGLGETDVVINAGRAGDAWSGGDAWKDADVVVALTEFVCKGGIFLGVDQPSAVEGYASFFRMAHVLGVDEDTGSRVCHGKWAFETSSVPGLDVSPELLGEKKNLFLTDGQGKVLSEKNGIPQMVIHSYGKGYGIYLSSFHVSPEASRLLLKLLMFGREDQLLYIADHPCVDCAWFASSGTLAAANYSMEKVSTVIHTPQKDLPVDLEPMELKLIRL